MSTLTFCIKVSRPIQIILGGLAAWIVALLSNGPDWFNAQKVAAGMVMAFSILGASIWHYGARADIYAKKHWDPVIVKNPKLLLLAGGMAFFASIILARIFLPEKCLIIAIANAMVIIFYARLLDRYWPWKNLFIAGICITPLLLGWFSGHRLNPIVPPMILAAFFFYLSREIFKDIMDIEANRGKRFTMVMSIGTPAALRIGGLTLMVSILFIVYSLRYAPTPVVWVISVSGVSWLCWFAVQSLRGENITSKFRWMDLGVASILFSLLVTRISMY